MLTRLVTVLLPLCGWLFLAAPADARQDTASYLVFLQQRAIGREEVRITTSAEGITVSGTSRLAAPIDITTDKVDIRYDPQWRPLSAQVTSVARGTPIVLQTRFAGGQAISTVTAGDQTSEKTDTVSETTIVLPNTFLGSYAVLAQRLRGRTVGDTLQGYVVPQIEVPIRVLNVATERIDTPRESIPTTRYTLSVENPPPAGAIEVTLWASASRGDLLRMSIPGQGLELSREDIASAATRTAQFSLPTDERVTIPAAGFNIAGTLTRPPGVTGARPAVVLIAGSGLVDRDETVAGIPIFGHLARGLVDAGFIVVRYDKRGVGQTGGRAESASLADYAEDARTIIRWLERRPEVDKTRLALVGHSEGAAVAMLLAASEKRVKAAVLVAGPGTTGADLILEQQRHALDLMKATDADRAEKVDLQQRIHAAVLKGTGWEGIPDEMRRAADTPWFQSLLAFDPSKTMPKVEQPLLVVQGELDTQVPPHHGDTLLALARARKKKADAQLLRVPGINHLLVPATTGEVSEYASLSGREVAPAVTTGISDWLLKTLAVAPARP